MYDTLLIWTPNEPEGYGAFDEDQNTEEDPRKIELDKIDNIKFEDIDRKDYPDFCDAFILSADMNGYPMTEMELEKLNEDSEFVHEKLFDYLY